MKYIGQFHDGMHISDVYLCKKKQIALTKNGKEYGALTLQDKARAAACRIPPSPSFRHCRVCAGAHALPPRRCRAPWCCQTRSAPSPRRTVVAGDAHRAQLVGGAVAGANESGHGSWVFRKCLPSVAQCARQKTERFNLTGISPMHEVEQPRPGTITSVRAPQAAERESPR